MKRQLQLLAVALVLFILLGPLVGLLATGVIPLFAYMVGALPAAVAGLLLGVLRLSLDKAMDHWRAHWHPLLFLLAALIPGALIGGLVAFYDSLYLRPALYTPLFSYFLGAVAGGVCNAVFWWHFRQAPGAHSRQDS